jgi:hypothetical protein
MTMAQELESKMRALRAEMTRLVQEGTDEDGLLLRRMLAELERLEKQRLALRSYPMVGYDIRAGGSPVGLAI